MGLYIVEFTSAVLFSADASLKGDKNLESYSGQSKGSGDYSAWHFSHVDSRGLLLFFNHALHERIAIVSDGSVGERSLYTQIGAVARRVLVVVVDVHLVREIRKPPNSEHAKSPISENRGTPRGTAFRETVNSFCGFLFAGCRWKKKSQKYF